MVPFSQASYGDWLLSQLNGVSPLISSNCCWPISAIPSPVQNKSSAFYMKNEVITQWIQWLIAHRGLWEIWDNSVSAFKRQREVEVNNSQTLTGWKGLEMHHFFRHKLIPHWRELENSSYTPHIYANNSTDSCENRT